MGADGTEPDDDKSKKLNEDFVEFMRKRSDTETPRYTAQLKTYVDFQRKRDRASAARRKLETGHHEKTNSAPKKKVEEEQIDKAHETTDHPGGNHERVNRRGADGKFMPRTRSFSRSRSGEPSDKCGRRRRRRRRRRSCGRRRRRRRRSCRRRRKRRRSCRRRRSRRRRRRSCCRRRRRRRRRRRC